MGYDGQLGTTQGQRREEETKTLPLDPSMVSAISSSSAGESWEHTSDLETMAKYKTKLYHDADLYHPCGFRVLTWSPQAWADACVCRKHLSSVAVAIA
jgi:hypothetical protein